MIIPYSALTGAGLDDLIEAWRGEADWSGDLEVNYDRYAAAEAQLAWLNQQVDLRATGNSGFNPFGETGSARNPEAATDVLRNTLVKLRGETPSFVLSAAP